jgi:hypothetical protein
MSFTTCSVTKYFSGDQIKEEKMGGDCRKHGRNKETDHLEDLGVDGKIIL